MKLLDLPNEVLEDVVTYTSPYGLENLALTCKRFHTLCTPHFAYHKSLRSDFHRFFYYNIKSFAKSRPAMLTADGSISSAFNLIARIAIEPVIGRYIQEADFLMDSEISKGKYREFVTDESCDEAMMQLLASSPHLKQAGLDWKEYWATMEEDLDDRCYSQHAAAFVLTLLPNVRRLDLPKWWQPQAVPNKLIDTMIAQAQNNPLAQLTDLIGHGCSDGEFNLDWAASFLTLPQVRYFGARRCKGGGNSNTALKYEALESVSFVHASIDATEISHFLRYTPNLKSFKLYDPPSDWDLCQFVAAIEKEVGDHLMELSILLRDAPFDRTLRPGRAALRGFKRLERLQLPLKVVSCNLTAAASDFPEPLVQDLIPSTLMHLSFPSLGTDEEAKALAIFFRGLSAMKAQAPSLKEIHLTLPSWATELYTDHFAKVRAEIKDAGFGFSMDSSEESGSWEDEDCTRAKVRNHSMEWKWMRDP